MAKDFSKNTHQTAIGSRSFRNDQAGENCHSPIYQRIELNLQETKRQQKKSKSQSRVDLEGIIYRRTWIRITWVLWENLEGWGGRGGDGGSGWTCICIPMADSCCMAKTTTL